MSPNRSKPALAIATAALFLLPYSAVNAWDFWPATAGLIGLYAWFFPGRWRERLGLALTARDWGLCALLLVAVTWGFHALILSWLPGAGMSFDPSAWSPALRTRPVLQALNEEIVFRALLLGWIIRRWPGMMAEPRGRLRLSASVAAGFAGAHVAFYLLKQGVLINAGAFLTYFLFGLLCNSLYLRFRHIGFGYALHLGWNLTRFTGDFRQGGRLLLEGEAVRLLEGAPALNVLLAVATLSYLIATRRRAQAIER